MEFLLLVALIVFRIREVSTLPRAGEPLGKLSAAPLAKVMHVGPGDAETFLHNST